VTELLYQVVFKGSVRSNGQEITPSFIKSDIETAVSSVSVYNDQLPTRAEYSFTVVLDGIPASRSVVLQQLTAGWTSQSSTSM